MAKTFLIIKFLGSTNMVIISFMLMGDMPPRVLARMIGGAIGGVLANLASFLVWWFYFKISKRVRNTYGDPMGTSSPIPSRPTD